MSDLFCPATLLLAAHVAAGEGGSLGEVGRAQAAALGEAVVGRRVAGVHCSGGRAAVQTAEVIGARTGVAVSPTTALSASGGAVSDVLDELEALADRHRGETVLVVTEPATLVGVLRLVLGPGLEAPGTGVLVELERDADGWALRPSGRPRRPA